MELACRCFCDELIRNNSRPHFPLFVAFSAIHLDDGNKLDRCQLLTVVLQSCAAALWRGPHASVPLSCIHFCHQTAAQWFGR